MKPTRRHLDDIFAGARPLQPKRPLYSADELRSIITSPVAVGKSRPFWLSTGFKMAAAACLLVASVAAGVALYNGTGENTSQSASGQQQPPANIQTNSEAAATSELPTSNPTVPAEESGRTTDRDKAQRQSRTIEASALLNPAQEIVADNRNALGSVPSDNTLEKRTVRPALASPLKIRGLRFLELSDDELGRLGIAHTADGYELAAQEFVRCDGRETRQRVACDPHKTKFKEFYAQHFGGDTTQTLATLKYKISLDTFSTACLPIRYPVASTIHPTVSPLIISQDYYRNADDQGRLVVTFENPLLLDSISKFNRQVFEMYTSSDSVSECRDITKYSLLSKLVPVRIRMGGSKDKASRIAGSDIILWYYPSREFIDALPQQLADRLRIELGFTTLVEEGVLHAEELKKRYCGEYNYLDVCRTKDGAISISSIVPNPASDRAMVKVHVAEQRNFTVSLHDMSGNRVAHLTNLQLRDSEVVAIDVSDKPAGTYLVAITSDRGEQVVERLIVGR